MGCNHGGGPLIVIIELIEANRLLYCLGLGLSGYSKALEMIGFETWFGVSQSIVIIELIYSWVHGAFATN